MSADRDAAASSPAPAGLRLLLIRHGETAANRQMRYLGSLDHPLAPDLLLGQLFRLAGADGVIYPRLAAASPSPPRPAPRSREPCGHRWVRSVLPGAGRRPGAGPRAPLAGAPRARYHSADRGQPLRPAGLDRGRPAADYKAPWLDEAPEVDEMSDIVVPREPGQSVLGCRFLKLLLEDPEVVVEPEAGSVRLATREAKVNLTGGVLAELFRYIEDGAEILSAKMFVGQVPFRFDALSWRLNGLKLEPVKNEHWTVDLDQRLEQIAAVFDLLDGKYGELKERLGEAAGAPVAAPIEAAPEAEALPA